MTTLYSNGTVQHYVLLSGYLGCDYDFTPMPFDSHECKIEITFQNEQSFTFKNLESGTDKGLEVRSSINLPE